MTLARDQRSASPGVDSGPLLQRACACAGAPALAPSGVHDLLRAPGRPLDGETRHAMESRFDHDFSQVRVHTGREADASAAAVQAEAYTVGQHVVFRDGRYAPSTDRGRSLLAHELAHTVQQGDAPLDRPLRVSAPGDAGEREAHGLAASAAAGEAVAPAAPAPAQVARANREFLLTFDDGPHVATLGGGKNRTENVLDSLCKKQARSAFFVQTAALDPEGHKMRGSAPVGQKLIKRMHDDGHAVGIHTGGKKDHELHTEAEKAGRLKTELGDAKDFLKGITGVTPSLVRPPKGKLNADVSKTYKSLSLTNVLWDIDGDQGADLPAKTLEQRVRDGVANMVTSKWKGTTPFAPQVVVLYHDIQKGTSQHIETLIDLIKSETTKQTGGADSAVFPKPTCKAKAAAPGKTPAPAKQPPAKEEPPAKKDTPAPPETRGPVPVAGLESDEDLHDPAAEQEELS